MGASACLLFASQLFSCLVAGVVADSPFATLRNLVVSLTAKFEL
jgi:hypothetical protein